MSKFERIMDSEIRQAILHACTANGCPDLAAEITVEFSDRIVGTPGRTDLRRKLIKLSNRIFQHMTLAQQVESVSRETCCLIGWRLYQNPGYDGVWQGLMRKAGFPDAKRVVELPKQAEAKRRGLYSLSKSPYTFRCGCRRGFKLPAVPARQIALEGALKACDKCGKAISLMENKNDGKAPLRLA